MSNTWIDDPRPLSPARRALAEQHLKQAEEVVALGRVHIASQVRVVDELRKDGNDTSSAEQLLQSMLTSQRLHEEHRDRLRQELGLG